MQAVIEEGGGGQLSARYLLHDERLLLPVDGDGPIIGGQPAHRGGVLRWDSGVRIFLTAKKGQPPFGCYPCYSLICTRI